MTAIGVPNTEESSPEYAGGLGQGSFISVVHARPGEKARKSRPLPAVKLKTTSKSKRSKRHTSSRTEPLRVSYATSTPVIEDVLSPHSTLLSHLGFHTDGGMRMRQADWGLKDVWGMSYYAVYDITVKWDGAWELFCLGFGFRLARL